MKNKKKFETLKNFRGFAYITVIVPVTSSEHGDIINVKPGDLEQFVAAAIIEHRVPLRGKEVRFLRKSLDLSLERFASEIGLTSGSILKWEKAESERLHPINEVAARAYLAKELKVDLPGKYSELLGKEEEAAPFTLKAS